MARKRTRRRTDAAAKAARSKRRPRRDRDGLWKRYLHAFFPIFFATFEPEIAAEVDWETLEIVTRELFTKVRGGSRRLPDFVARVKRRDGRPEVFALHFEIQGARRSKEKGGGRSRPLNLYPVTGKDQNFLTRLTFQVRPRPLAVNGS